MFTQSCFIRKNTPELQKKLESLGYKKDSYLVKGNCIATAAIIEPCYCIITEEMFDDTNPNTTWGVECRIDCSDNERLFIAIAALRDDTDENQWFTNGKDYWYQNKVCDREVERGFSGFLSLGFHKATVEELIERFKK